MINMTNIIAVLGFLALVVAPPAFGIAPFAFEDVKTHTLTVEERLERIEHINVTAEKKIKKDRYADKEVMAALQEARKKMRAKWEDMTEEERKAAREKMSENKAAREKMRKGMKHKQRRHSHPHSHKGRPHRHGPR